MKRRDFLASSIMTLSALMTQTGWASGALPALGDSSHKSNQSRFLFIFLRGGMDGMHLLTPRGAGFEFYKRCRPNIHIPEDKSIAITDQWGLNPEVAEFLLPLWNDKTLAFVPYAGSIDTSRSHFDTQAFMETGRGSGPGSVQGGFMGRLSLGLNAGAASFTEVPPAAFFGDPAVLSIPVSKYAKEAFTPKQKELIVQLYEHHALERKVEEGFALRQDMAGALAAEMEAAAGGAPNVKGFEQAAIRAAKLMKDKNHIGFMDVGGWDTHANQGNHTGYLSSNLKNLAAGLAAFVSEMGPLMKSTTVYVATEFGRTFKENGSRGTDHGRGSVHLMLGSPWGGTIVGKSPTIEESILDAKRDAPMLNDWRDQVARLLQAQALVSAEKIKQALPGTLRS